MDALRKQGVRIPEDVLVAGFDDIPEAAWDAYRLTTFVQDGEKMVAETLRLIERQGHGEAAKHRTVIVPAGLVERYSTRKSSALSRRGREPISSRR